ncbi:hypothetical protein LSH36_557g01031 [Paralvinella palmiformis]|uniref:Uncharacterized protein n=1 Tax=Paralvinella palmiformis TaxID=53620 RepID=A0AAD9J672_9ANNE|nr:hypothetical protein LSH36_557g01031 [Paralvinella palmiformis]
MATIRAIQGNWSFSQSIRSYFSCCLGGHGSKDGSTKADVITRSTDFDSDGDSNEILANGTIKKKASYGSVKSSKSLTSHKSNKSSGSHKSLHISRVSGDGAEDLSTFDIHLDDPEQSGSKERIEVIHVVTDKDKEGNAYAYEEQDTSSDSDDEVLRRYQQSIQRVPSQRSVHSTRSQKSSASKVSKTNIVYNNSSITFLVQVDFPTFVIGNSVCLQDCISYVNLQ